MEYITTDRKTTRYAGHLVGTDTADAYKLAALDMDAPAVYVDLATAQAVLNRRRAILAEVPDWTPAAVRRLARRAEWQAQDTAAAAYTTAARDIAKTTARNAVSREYTDTQWEIWTAAKCRKWDLPDLADMVSSAVVGLVSCTADPDTATDTAAALADYADTIAAAPRHDPAAAVVSAQAKVSGHAPAESVRDTTAAARRMARMADTIATAAAADNAADYTAAAYLAGYRAVNNYLTDNRAIRVSETPPALRLSDLDTDPAAVDTDTDTTDPAAQAWLAGAWRDTLAALTPTRRRLLRLLYRGYSIRAAAAAMRIAHPTALEHIAAIRATAAAVFATRRDTDRYARYLPATLAAILDTAPADPAAVVASAHAAAALATAAAARDTLRAETLATMSATARAVILATVDTMPPMLGTLYALTAAGLSIRAAAAAMDASKSTTARRADNAAAHIAAAVVSANIGVDPVHAAALTLADWTLAAR